ncbi:MAG: 2Fe-2S iron-sulfur cluster binding domain-containing protein [Elusimicrobia bacterium]|nr:2Fe-2S iron-sulfur cluster binding domain-containing protein [Elusimicrobiota bacterium]
MANQSLTVDGKNVEFGNERNLLEVIRKAKIELPTFCYHSELSVYGACRLCMVDVKGRGLLPACSTPPEKGMEVSTGTEQIRRLRKIIVELLLASHNHACPTCAKSTNCQLQALAKRMGVSEVRFKSRSKPAPKDESAPSIVRDPNKCVLCGDCVRVCSEIQGIGAIDFAYRGSSAAVIPAFGKNLKEVECVHCGQCARVCPTGALLPKSEISKVWKAVEDKDLLVVAQVAPAVRVAIGEQFGLEPGTTMSGQIVAALKAMGFDKVFDTSFAADLTVIEETEEFLARVAKGERLPQFTSCCPAWVKYVEQYHPELLPQLSSCKSPQQMFGSVAKEIYARQLGLPREKIFVVSVMPCTAKKFKAGRPEFSSNGNRDVDCVITTQELALMIEERGLSFRTLEPESFDLPLGFKTGAGVIFGNSGGVAEAALRYAAEKLSGQNGQHLEFTAVRGDAAVRAAQIKIKDKTLRVAVVNGLAAAKKLLEAMKKGEASYDFVEVMACPGGCIGGAGQPVYKHPQVRGKRASGLYDNDKMLQLHKSQENPYIAELYSAELGKPGSEKAHRLLHTWHCNQRRIHGHGMDFSPSGEKGVTVDVCFGTSCMLKGSQTLFKSLAEHVQREGLSDKVGLKASFCFENCGKGPVVKIDGKRLEKCTRETAMAELKKALEGK